MTSSCCSEGRFQPEQTPHLTAKTEEPTGFSGRNDHFRLHNFMKHVELFSRMSEACESFCHELDDGGLYEGEAGLGESLEVL